MIKLNKIDFTVKKKYTTQSRHPSLPPFIVVVSQTIYCLGPNVKRKWDGFS